MADQPNYLKTPFKPKMTKHWVIGIAVTVICVIIYCVWSAKSGNPTNASQSIGQHIISLNLAILTEIDKTGRILANKAISGQNITDFELEFIHHSTDKAFDELLNAGQHSATIHTVWTEIRRERQDILHNIDNYDAFTAKNAYKLLIQKLEKSVQLLPINAQKFLKALTQLYSAKYYEYLIPRYGKQMDEEVVANNPKLIQQSLQQLEDSFASTDSTHHSWSQSCRTNTDSAQCYVRVFTHFMSMQLEAN